MKRLFFLLALVPFTLISCAGDETMDELAERVFKTAQEQVMIMADSLGPDETPKTFENGKLVKRGPEWWCSGFFPGTLWQVYEYTKNQDILSLAKRETDKVEPMKYIEDHHDVGFMINCSFGHQYRLTGDDRALDVLRTAARSLTVSFSPTVGCIKSWPFVLEGFEWEYPVIIDNMMNLELLMSVGKMDKDDKLCSVAIAHADKTMQNHFRDDYTCCHLVDYDPQTGLKKKMITVQGLADSSAWARGQAWALYGYTMMYQYTGDEKYLHWAQNVADMIITHLPEDGIPYWDFDCPKIPDTYRDASAGAVMASAFVSLSTVADNGKSYLPIAEKQIRTLASPEYLAGIGENGGFLLKHSVGSLPDDSEVDVPLTYADYYFLEAVLKYLRLDK